MRSILSVLLLIAASSLLHAQNDRPPEVTNLEQVKNSIQYPSEAKSAGIEGKVIVLVTVDEKGKVAASEIKESPHDLLSEAVRTRVGDLKFSPATQGGKAIKSKVEVPFLFELPKTQPVLTSLSRALADPEGVVELDLSGQKLDDLDGQVASLKNLRKINLDGNRFSKFPGVLCKLPLLEEISIADNQLKNVPRSLRKLSNLNFIDLRGNPIPTATTRDIRETLEHVDEVLMD